MLLVKYIRENFETVNQNLKKRKDDYQVTLKAIIETDITRRGIQNKLNQKEAEINRRSSQIPQLKKSGKQSEAIELIKKNGVLKKEVQQLKTEFKQIGERLESLLVQVPNVPHAEVPYGTTDKDNELIAQRGEIPDSLPNALPHWELASKFGLIEFELGAKVTGRGFPVYIGKMAQLQRALISFFLDRSTQAGYKEFTVPLLVNYASGFGTGQLPDKEGQMYHIDIDDLYLIPTSEVPLTNLFRDRILKEFELPLKLTSYTPCFRREAGNYGSDVKGLNRLHQFDKVEIVRIEKPEQSSEALKEMILHVQNLLEELDLPYRIVKLCGGDLGFAASITYDFEVFSAVQKKWLEVSSVSNFTNYQSNRLKLRYSTNSQKILAHTLNGSALALPRILACLIENFQQEKEIIIPKCLHSYTGFDAIELEE